MLTLSALDVEKGQDATFVVLRDEEARGSITRALPRDPKAARRVLDDAISKLTQARDELFNALTSDLPE